MDFNNNNFFSPNEIQFIFFFSLQNFTVQLFVFRLSMYVYKNYIVRATRVFFLFEKNMSALTKCSVKQIDTNQKGTTIGHR